MRFPFFNYMYLDLEPELCMLSHSLEEAACQHSLTHDLVLSSVQYNQVKVLHNYSPVVEAFN